MKNQCLVIICLIASGGAAAKDYCKYERDIEQNLAVEDRLIVEAGAGKLHIIGDPSSEVIQINAQACASSEKILDRISLRTVEGNTAEIETLIPKTSGWFSGDRYASVHLELTVPAAIALQITDGSGSIELESIGTAIIDDGSGSITVRGATGDIELSDGSGSITVRDVEGAVIVNDDGSGSIDIVNVRDRVEIGSDGSGSIKISDVGGDVRIGSDGSGSIDVNEIAGNFVVRSDGSGGIDFNNVDGELDLPRDKYRDRK